MEDTSFEQIITKNKKQYFKKLLEYLQVEVCDEYYTEQIEKELDNKKPVIKQDTSTYNEKLILASLKRDWKKLSNSVKRNLIKDFIKSKKMKGKRKYYRELLDNFDNLEVNYCKEECKIRDIKIYQ